MRVRFATHAAALKVMNLGPLVTNELLHSAFSQFGDVERAVVVCDDRGRSKGYGIVEFSRRNSAQTALQQVNDGLFLLGRYSRIIFQFFCISVPSELRGDIILFKKTVCKWGQYETSGITKITH